MESYKLRWFRNTGGRDENRTSRSRGLYGVVIGVFLALLLAGFAQPVFAVTPQIAAGYYHTVALKNDGTVWSWGKNSYGGLGNGTTTDSATPIQVPGLTGVTAVAAGFYHTIALKNDGTVWVWGRNNYGQLGNGTTTDNATPEQVSALTGITAIAAGGDHSVALKNDGTAWAWGYNGTGQLGNGTTTDSSTPVQVSGLTGLTAITAGYWHTAALKNDGTVLAWGGEDYFSYLGNGTLIHSSSPVQVAELTGVIAIVSGSGSIHTVALKNDGTIWGWGNNDFGQLGNTSESGDMPVQIAGLTGVTTVATGRLHTVVLKSDGTVWAWGDNRSGELGNGTTTYSDTPIQVTGLTGVIAIAAGSERTMALKADGSVWAWGDNSDGQLGNGTTTNSATPLPVAGLAGVSAIAAGAAGGWSYENTMALHTDGTVWAWGDNSDGQLGNGTTTNSATPLQVSGLTGVAAIAAGDFHTVALKTDGTVWAWGYNYNGQLGNGTTIKEPVFNYITTPVQTSGLTGVIAVAAGTFHTVALKSDGTVWSWGENRGTLNNDSISESSIPLQIPGISGVIAIAAGDSFTMVLKADGTVWSWGWGGLMDGGNAYLGNGTTTGSSTPVQASGLTGVTAIAVSGGWHRVALKSDGTVWVWGRNDAGQLGNGTTTDSSTPVQVPGVTGVTAIAAGFRHTAALKNDGTVLAWGRNDYGQLGNGTKTDSTTPVQVSGLTGVAAISGGEYHTVALKTDGTVLTWGLAYNPIKSPVQALINLGKYVYTVSFTADSGGGTLSGPTSQMIEYGGTTTAVTALPATGYHFVNWTGTNGFATTTTNPLTASNVTAAQNITANFAINSYIVNFTTSGGSTVTSQNVTYNSTATQPAAPVKTGYAFICWYSDNGLTSAFNFTTAITGATTLYAKWLNSYTVTPDAGNYGGITPATPRTVNQNATTSFTVTPTSGYAINSVTGCGGTLNGTTYTTGAITGDCTVTVGYTGAPHSGIVVPASGKTAPDIGDALKAYRHMNGASTLSTAEKAAADVGPLGGDGKPAGDGTIDVGDVVVMLRRILGAASW